MKLVGRKILPTVEVIPESGLPIRLRLSGHAYAMEAAEAVQLANDLADAVEDIDKERIDE